MGLLKNRDKFYLDTLARTQKSETVLSLIQATYHTRNIDSAKRKDEIGKRLKAAYDLFRDNAKGKDTGSGTYNNSEGQFESQYTIGHELGIWINSNLDLAPLAEKVAHNFLTIRDYFDVVFLNLFQCINKKGINILYIVLCELEESRTLYLTKDIIFNSFKKITNKAPSNDVVNGFLEMFKGTNYFLEDSEKKVKLNIDLDILKNSCNLKFHNAEFEEIDSYFSNDRMKYSLYLTTNNHSKSIYSNKKNIDRPHQRIFFGAPGTGKSFELNKEAKEYFGDNYERVTFYPNYMYGNFVGAFKPFPKILRNLDGTIKKDEDENIQETITYEYIPGVLMKQLVKALKNPNENYLLLIEEINRANVAAVFGDVFQLLDRDGKGQSEYVIATSRELQEYLKKEFDGYDLAENIKQNLGNNYSRLYLPNNLYIWATMNSADQGVMPMDTAFRRRWEFRYIGINDIADSNKEDFSKYKFKLNSSETVKWDLFRRELNKRLSMFNIPEDKLIGPYFVSKSILEDSDLDRLTETIKNKVLMYLYEDVAKAHRSSLFAEGKYATYSDVCKYFSDNALSVFKGNIEIETETINKNANWDNKISYGLPIAAENKSEYKS